MGREQLDKLRAALRASKRPRVDDGSDGQEEAGMEKGASQGTPDVETWGMYSPLGSEGRASLPVIDDEQEEEGYGEEVVELRSPWLPPTSAPARNPFAVPRGLQVEETACEMSSSGVYRNGMVEVRGRKAAGSIVSFLGPAAQRPVTEVRSEASQAGPKRSSPRKGLKRYFKPA
jgi:hypothetical protein